MRLAESSKARRSIAAVAALTVVGAIGVFVFAPPGALSRKPPAQDISAASPAGGTASPSTSTLLASQLAAARRTAARYPTLAKALRAGFTQAAPYAPGIGSHYMKYSLIYEDFNPAKPDMLLFDGDVPTSKLVGLAYYIYDSQGPPEGFAGPFDHWHQHRLTCVGRTGAHFEGDDDASECRGRGRNAWMLHVWVTPGYQTVNLVFSDFCNLLT